MFVQWLRDEFYENLMILILAGQSQPLSQMCTGKISHVFNRIRTHDLCDACAVLLPTKL